MSEKANKGGVFSASANGGEGMRWVRVPLLCVSGLAACGPVQAHSQTARTPSGSSSDTSRPPQKGAHSPVEAKESSPPRVGGTPAPSPRHSRGASEADQPGGASERPWFGADLLQRDAGVEIEGVQRGSPAASAGLLPGDTLLSVDGVGVRSPAQLREVLARAGVGRRVSVSVRRAGRQRLFALVLASTPPADERLRAEYIGSVPPSISRLLTVQGSQVPSWAALQGQVVVLEFWAGWCVACRALTPQLNRFHETLTARGVRVLGVTSEPFEEAVRASRLLGLHYPTFVDEDGAVTHAFQALALPTLFVVDKRGIIREMMIGLEPQRLQRLDKLLEELIHE